MKVAVVGSGYVGLVTGVALASLGHHVIEVDVDEEKIALLQQGIPPFYEQGLQEALMREMSARRLSFTLHAAEALRSAEVVLICVGTPARPDGEANLSALERAATEIARHAKDGVVVVEKSTVPAGTAEQVRLTLLREGGGRRFHVASNPEFLRGGMALRDALEPDRIVIGVDSEPSLRVLQHLYKPLIRNGTRLIVTDLRTAELAKHASNAFLAVKISFANALARVCERAGADVSTVADVMGADPRIGRAFLDAGLGYGGSCLPKDVSALERLADRLGYEFALLRAVQRVNREAIEATARKLEDALWNLEGKRIALLGLAFKPGTEEVRCAPALALARHLLASGANVVGYDPRAARNAKEDLPALDVASDPYEAAAGAHALVLATEWEEFRRLDLVMLRRVMSYPIVVDGRNLFDPTEMGAAGFWYYPTGRPPILQDSPPVPGAASDRARERPTTVGRTGLQR